MLQEIAPHQYHPEYMPDTAPRDGDLVCVFEGRGVLLRGDRYPTVAELRALGVTDDQLVYLFRSEKLACVRYYDINPAHFIEQGDYALLMRDDIRLCRETYP